MSENVFYLSSMYSSNGGQKVNKKAGKNQLMWHDDLFFTYTLHVKYADLSNHPRCVSHTATVTDNA